MEERVGRHKSMQKPLLLGVHNHNAQTMQRCFFECFLRSPSAPAFEPRQELMTTRQDLLELREELQEVSRTGKENLEPWRNRDDVDQSLQNWEKQTAKL